MGWQTDGLNIWLAGDNVSKISRYNQWRDPVNPTQMTWIIVNFQVISTHLALEIWYFEDLQQKSHGSLCLTWKTAFITLVLKC